MFLKDAGVAGDILRKSALTFSEHISANISVQTHQSLMLIDFNFAQKIPR